MSHPPLLWSGESCNNLAGKLLSVFTTNGFEQLIDEPTHFPMGNIETCIDLILSNNETAFSDIGVLPSIDTHCKHQIVFGKTNVPAPPIYRSKIWEYKACNISNFRHDLKCVDWAKLLDAKSIDEMTDIFTKTFLEIATRHTPSKLISVSDKDAPLD